MEMLLWGRCSGHQCTPTPMRCSLHRREGLRQLHCLRQLRQPKQKTTGWGLQQQAFISRSSGGCKSRIQVPAESDGGHSGLPTAAFSLCPQVAERVLCCLFSEGQESHYAGPTLTQPQLLLQRTHLQIQSHWGLELHHVNFWGTQKFDPLHLQVEDSARTYR